MIFKVFYFLISFLVLSMFSFAAESNGVVFVPPGQLKSNLVKVYVLGAEIEPREEPHLYAYKSNFSGSSAVSILKPVEVFPNSQYQKEGEPPKKGTLLLFNLSDNKSYDALSGNKFTRYFMGARFYPVVKWGDVIAGPSSEGGEQGSSRSHVAVPKTDSTVLVGSLFSSGIAIFVVLLFVVLWIGIGSWVRSKRFLQVFIGGDGSFSLSKVQLGAWTIVSVFCVGTFGLAYELVPEIPSSLVVLLGLSIATTGSAYAFGRQISDADGSDDKVVAKAAVEGVKKKNGKLDSGNDEKPPSFFYDLISLSGVKRGENEVSIAKAQMLLWTIVSLCLFIVKSLLNGALWVVPWELVCLMGLSQTSYVAPKYWKWAAAKK